jgi:TonB-linked SusC/RagA family outer membrane protein
MLFRISKHAAIKTFCLMNWTAALLLAGFLQASATGYTQGKITLSLKNAPLEKVFAAIETQSGYSIWYDNTVLENTEPMDIQIRDVSLEQALTMICDQQPIGFHIVGKMVTISKKKLSPVNSPAAKIDVRGRVVNEKGDPGAGVSVSIKGSHTGSKTDMAGFFELTGVDENSTLIFSGANIETLEEKLNGRKEITVTVKIKLSKLDEVDIIGYGTTTKRLNTGDVSTVRSDIIAEQPVSNVLAALEGRVPGLVITQDNGIAGSTFHVQIRGQNSINSGNDPLYIVDGVPFNSLPLTQNHLTSFQLSPFNSLNPSDIDNVSILKDADATAIYGSRGANGVILITTKKGKAGKTNLDINVNTGPGQVTRTLRLLNTQQYLAMRHEAFINDSYTPTLRRDADILVWDTTRYTNWQKVLIGNTMHSTDAQVGLSGGNAFTQFLISGNFHYETSVFPGDFADTRGGLHFNLSHSSQNRKFTISFSSSFTMDQNNLPAEDLAIYELYLPPNAPPIYDSAHKINWAGNTWNNPLAATLTQYNTRTDNLISSMNLNYSIGKGLMFRAGLGYTQTWMNEAVLSPETSLNPSYGLHSSALFGNNQLKTWNIEPQLEYIIQAGPGRLNVLAGMTLQQTTEKGYALNASGYSTDELLPTLAGASLVTTAGLTDYQYKYSALFGRINYNISDQLIFNFTGRRDGSSRFGPGKQFANFGAVGAAWVFSKQEWLSRNFSYLSFGKLRSSYGTTGNDQIGNYQFMSSYSPGFYPYQNTIGLLPNNLTNPDYSWEVNQKLEVGLDLGFMKDRLLASVSYYRNRSSNQIVSYPLPGTTGFSSITANLPAMVQNTGWEVELNATLIKNLSFGWKASFNISFPGSKLISFPDLENSQYANLYIVGQPLKITKLNNLKGVDPTTGLYIFLDAKGNETSNPIYPTDNTHVVDLSTKYYGGLSNSFQWRGWQVDIFFQFTKHPGFLLLPANAPGQKSNQNISVLGRWQQTGDISTVQKFTATFSDGFYAYQNAQNPLSISDGSFIRLKNLALSYRFSAARLKSMHLTALRFYIQGQNLFTLTSFDGSDPETQVTLPPIRMITAGIQISL